MSFHLYIEPELQDKLDALCKKTGQRRNSVVREALREYLSRRLERSWEDAVFRFEPDPEMASFETLRMDLLAERDDVFQGNG